MAHKIVLTCDVDGDDTEAEGTVKFGLDGREYEIELCSRHHKELSGSLRPFVEKARKVEGTRGRRRNQRASTPPSAAPTTPSAPMSRSAISTAAPGRAAAAARRDGTRTVREWAKAQGMTVSDRGRISTEIAEAYAAAHR
jgi:hypothetical protein